MARTHGSIKRAIWTDPEWLSLGREAQWLHMARKLQGQAEKFSVADALTWASGVTVDQVAAAVEELKMTKYGHVLKKLSTREKIPLDLRREVYAADGWKCAFCRSTRKLEIDHIIPLSKGGTDDRSNLQTLCEHCNRKKGATL